MMKQMMTLRQQNIAMIGSLVSEQGFSLACDNDLAVDPSFERLYPGTYAGHKWNITSPSGSCIRMKCTS